MIRAYLANRSTLSCVFVLIDSRIPPQKIDLEFIHWLGSMQVPFVITFTKIDKIKKNAIQKQVNSFYAELKKMWEDLPECFVTSSVTNAGYEEIHGFIESINKDLPSPE